MAPFTLILSLILPLILYPTPNPTLTGLFAFSTEMATDAECRGKGWVERDSERVAHSEESYAT